MKRILGIAAGILLTCVLAMSASAVTMYSSDGRTIEVEWNDIKKYEQVWWRKEITVYKPDGTSIKSMTINPFEADKYEAEGWCREVKYYHTFIGSCDAFNGGGSEWENNPTYVHYGSPYAENYSESPTFYKGVLVYDSYSGYKNNSPFNYYYPSNKAVSTMYAPDGKMLFVKQSEIQAYRDAGWHDGIILFKKLVSHNENRYPQTIEYNVTTTISPFSTEEILKKYSEAGWREGVRMYSTNGTSQVFPSYQADLYRRSGWHYGYTMYNSDGEVKTVPEYDYDNHYNNGWRVSCTVYSIDETMTTVKKAEINPYLKDEYLAAGWLDTYPKKMYSIDGREIFVDRNKVTDFENVGWYTDKADVTVTMYADERTIEVFKGQIADYQAVGWSIEPVHIMYAEDGRTIYVPESQIEAYKAVGWYTSTYDLMTTVYAADGRTMEIFKGQVEAYKAVGWYPPLTVYKANSQYSSGYESTTINPFDFENYSKGGWYSEPVKLLYSIYGDSTVAPISQLEAYNAVGWYEYDDVYQKVYTLTDTKTVLKTNSWKYTSQGYSTQEPAFQIQKTNVGWPYEGYYRFPEFYVKGKRIYCRLPMIVNLTKGKIINKVEFQIRYFGANGKRIKISTGNTYSNHTVYLYAYSNHDVYTGNYGYPLGFGSNNLGGYIEEFTAPNYIHHIEITNYKAYFTDGTSASVGGKIEMYNYDR